MSRDSSNAQLDSSFRRRSADICYSPKGILVVANHQDIEGLGARGSPRELLGLDSSAERVGEAVLRSMHASREGLTKEEAKMESAETLKASGEKSWTTFEKRWQLIVASFEPGEQAVTIAPMKQYETGGYLGEVDDPTYSCPPRADEVGNSILAIIREGPPPIVPHEASHIEGGYPVEEWKGRVRPLGRCGHAHRGIWTRQPVGWYFVGNTID
jgi:hypothetical protein